MIRTVRELQHSDRSTIERLLGHNLHDDQQLVIQIVTPESASSSTAALPEWTRVYEGLSDNEIDDLESAVLRRADLSRHAEK